MYSCGSCFLWSCFSSQNFGDVFPCTKKSMMKKRYVFAKKNVRGRDAVARSAHDHRIREMAWTRPHCPTQTDIRLGLCVGVGLTSGTAVEETDYQQTPTSPAARWLSQRNDEVEEIVVARTPTNMVSDGSRAGDVCRTPGRECLFWPMPPYYISRIRGAGYVQQTH